MCVELHVYQAALWWLSFLHTVAPSLNEHEPILHYAHKVSSKYRAEREYTDGCTNPPYLTLQSTLLYKYVW